MSLNVEDTDKNRIQIAQPLFSWFKWLWKENFNQNHIFYNFSYIRDWKLFYKSYVKVSLDFAGRYQ